LKKTPGSAKNTLFFHLGELEFNRGG